jgi:DNA primase
MSYIPEDIVAKIFDTARIEEVIGDYVQLKRSGGNLKGLSPFNNERTPSFYVSPAKQIFKDFSSGKGGNVVTFLMEREHFTYPEALRFLAKRYNIEIPEREATPEEVAQHSERESIYLISKFAADFFKDSLLRTEIGQIIGLSYFKERGITEASIEKFGLGFSPPERDAFCKAALKNGYQPAYIEKSGLGISRDGQLFDRFRERVIFPIYSLQGRVLGFGGRILRSDVKAAKYLNSPENSIYHKSKVLYGLFQAKSAIIKNDRCYLVEGYTDVIGFSQAGIEHVVSASGTALSADQVSLIKRLTPNLTMIFDGDAAGLRAALRGIDIVLREGLQLRVVALPAGEDPDSFVRKHGAAATQAFLKDHEIDFISFKSKILLEDAGADPMKRAAVIKDIVESIAQIPDLITRELYARQCATDLNIEERTVFSELERALTRLGKEAEKAAASQGLQVVQSPQQTETSSTTEAPSGTPEGKTKHDPQERALIKLLVHFAQHEDLIPVINYTDEERPEPIQTTIGAYLLEELEREREVLFFESPFYIRIYELFKAYYDDNEAFPEPTFWTRHPEGDIAAFAASLESAYEPANWAKREVYVPEISKGLAKETFQSLLRFKSVKFESLINDFREKLQDPNEDISGLVSSLKDWVLIQSKIKQNLGQVV